MSVTHDPAQIALAVAYLIVADELEMQMFDVGIQLAEIAFQLDEPADLMQRIGEVHVGAVEVAQAVEIARVEAGELAGGRLDRKSTRLNYSPSCASRMPS